ncbi:MAG: glycoside hydrolase family 27 protein [Chitinophagaceae bacterium]
MGWSSWNHFHINISEQMLKEQADAMISSGMYAAGYRFINIDDGYLGGRDANGKLFAHPIKFPSGMDSLTAYIHSKGLKAGIYTDAGKNTCGSMYDKDSLGIGVGIYGHVQQDVDLFFKEWKFDFLKVDWCGGKEMKLDEQTEYSTIINAVKAIDSNLVFNICRWEFPGVWAIKKADSWRISGDIRENFASILKIIDLNRELYQYASPGHYNDMDMLQVGRGMTYEEDKTHFSMWCMLNSPLLAGNDLRKMSKETIEILTNKEVIALNQDRLFAQARRILVDGNVEVWLKPLADGGKAVAVVNRGTQGVIFELKTETLGVRENSKVRDLWEHRDLGRIGVERMLKLRGHGVVVMRVL